LNKLPPVGAYVLMQWVDAAEAPGWQYSAEEPKLWPRMITSRGTIVGRTPLGVVLCSHISEPSTGDNERGYLSLLAIPNGAILKVTKLADR
jgi:hypothetical protein